MRKTYSFITLALRWLRAEAITRAAIEMHAITIAHAKFCPVEGSSDFSILTV